MDLMVEFPGDRVVPWQRFGPRSQFFMSTASKQRTETLMAHRQVVQDQTNNMAIGTENSTIDCKELTILNNNTDQIGMSPHGARNVI